MITAPDVVWETGQELLNPGRAALSVDRVYRYQLERIWDAAWPPIVWLMLNPSKADASVDDATVKKITRFTRRWGSGGLIVVNLFAYRATEPAAIRGVPDPVGPLNDEFIADVCQPGSLVVAAWGVHGTLRGRGAAIGADLRKRDVRLLCLGLTNGGQPGHPLYVNERTPLRPYDGR